MWVFYLSPDGVNYTQLKNVDGSNYEPTGWDSVQFLLKRGPESSEPWIDGADFVFSNTITFDGEGAAMLKEAYELDGIDAVMYIRIYQSGCEYTFDGLVDFSEFNETPFCNDVDCPATITTRIYKSGFSMLLKNRFDVGVDLSKTTGLDGQVLTDIQGYELLLHSKEIYFSSKHSVNEFLKDYVKTEGDNPGGWAMQAIPFQKVYADIESSLEPSFYYPPYDNPILYSGFTYPPGVTTRTIRVKGRIKFTGKIRFASGVVRSYLYVRDAFAENSDANLQEIILLDVPDPGPENTVSVDESFDHTISVPANANIIIANQSSQYYNISYDPVSFVELSENSIITPSSVYSYTIMDALRKIVESITGTPDAVVSSFLEDDCYKHMVITNGLNIRKMRDKDGNLFPVVCSFKDLFDSLDAVYNLGLKVEKTLTGERVRIEHKSYFYQRTPADIEPNIYVPDITKSVNLENYFNEVEVGYSTWQTEDVNGLDEPNSRRTYSLPVKNVKKKLSKLCQFIAGGYLIEQTRRQQFKEKPTSDYATDNNLFFICTNRIEVTSDRYEINATGDPMSAVYQPGTVSERNELFTDVENLLSPQTAYNLRITPGNIIRWHYSQVVVSLYKKTLTLNFQSGQGNYQLRMLDNSECKISDNIINEGANVSAEDVVAEYREPLYIPELLEFSWLLSFEDFLKLTSNPAQSIGVSCGSELNFAGHIKSINFRPNDKGNTADFVLQRSGDFGTHLITLE